MHPEQPALRKKACRGHQTAQIRRTPCSRGADAGNSATAIWMASSEAASASIHRCLHSLKSTADRVVATHQAMSPSPRVHLTANGVGNVRVHCVAESAKESSPNSKFIYFTSFSASARSAAAAAHAHDRHGVLVISERRPPPKVFPNSVNYHNCLNPSMATQDTYKTSGVLLISHRAVPTAISGVELAA